MGTSYYSSSQNQIKKNHSIEIVTDKHLSNVYAVAASKCKCKASDVQNTLSLLISLSLYFEKLIYNEVVSSYLIIFLKRIGVNYF